MSFERAFETQFEKATERSLAVGVKGAPVEGCTYGVASALIYMAEALLFYVGAILLSHGTYSYIQMVEVLNLIIFTVTIGSQLMAFSASLSTLLYSFLDRIFAFAQPRRLRNRCRPLEISIFSSSFLQTLTNPAVYISRHSKAQSLSTAFPSRILSVRTPGYCTDFP
jgi:hypothetical protein